MFTVQVCGLVEHALCVCGNYSNLNAGSAGETGCLLINEPSRWPRVGGSCECTASRSGGQRDNDTWAVMCLCTSSEQCTRNYLLINGFEMQKCVHFFVAGICRIGVTEKQLLLPFSDHFEIL